MKSQSETTNRTYRYLSIVFLASIMVLVALKPGFTHLREALPTKLGCQPSSQVMVTFGRDFWAEFYAAHAERPFFQELVDYMSGSESVFMLFDLGVDKARQIIGSTDPAEAAWGTVRNLYGHSKTQNAVHCSDSPESCAREWSLVLRYLGASCSCKDTT